MKPRLKQSLFTLLVATVFLPTLAGAICVVAIAWPTSSHLKASRHYKEIADDSLVMTRGFFDLIEYGNHAISRAFEKKDNADNRVIDTALGPKTRNAESFKNALLLSDLTDLRDQVITLTAELNQEKFDSNLLRFRRIAKLMSAGSTYADRLSTEIKKESLNCSAESRSLQAQSNEAITIAAILSLLAITASFIAFSVFIQRVLNGVNSIAKLLKTMDLLEPVAGAGKTKNRPALDELAYVHESIAEPVNQVVAAVKENQTIMQMIAHDIRSPITAVQITTYSFIEAAAEQLSDEQITACGSVESELNDMIEMVSNLLLFNTLVVGHLELQKTDSDFFLLGQKAIANVRTLASPKAISFENNVSPLIHSVDGRLILLVMTIWLRFLIGQSKSGASVKANVRKDAGYLSWTVSTDGAVLSMAEKKAVFGSQHFAGASFLTPRQSLELRLTEHIVRAHGGMCRVISDEVDCKIELSIALNPVDSLRHERQLVPSFALPEARRRNPLEYKLIRQGAILAGLSVSFQVLCLTGICFYLIKANALDRAAQKQFEKVQRVSDARLKSYQAFTQLAFAQVSTNRQTKVDVFKSLTSLRRALEELSRDQWSDTALLVKAKLFLTEEIASIEKSLLHNGSSREFSPSIVLGAIPRVINSSRSLQSSLQSMLETESSRLALAQYRGIEAWEFMQFLTKVVFVLNIIVLAISVVLVRHFTWRQFTMLIQDAHHLRDGEPLSFGVKGEDELAALNHAFRLVAEQLRKKRAENSRLLEILAQELFRPLKVSIEILKELQSECSTSAHFTKSEIQLLENSISNLERTIHTVENLLDLAEADRSSIMVNAIPVSVRPFLSELCQFVSPLAKAKQVAISIVSPESVVYLDPLIIRQVLLNILTNAIKFSPYDSTILVLVEIEVDQIRFVIKDEGPGIDNSVFSRVFEQYEKSAQAPGSAFGLGLSISKTLVELHKGRIWFNNNPDAGCSFTVELPIAAD